MPASRAIELVIQSAEKISDPVSKKAYIQFYSETFNYEIVTKRTRIKDQLMNKRIVALCGLLGLVAMVVLVYFTPFVTKWQSGFMWVALCIFTAACCSVIPGFFEIKIKTWIRATGTIGIFVLMYLYPPAVSENDYTKPTEKLKLFSALYDTSSISIIPVDFSSNSSENICTFLKKSVTSYYGSSLLSDSLIFFRRIDGKIYSTEGCSDITDREVIVISNKVSRLFSDNRAAYLYIYRSIEQNHLH